jgi:hypothetical protein
MALVFVLPDLPGKVECGFRIPLFSCASILFFFLTISVSCVKKTDGAKIPATH